MSEHDPGELEPMSAAMREYVDAFATVERPSADVAPATWQAIEAEIEPRRRPVLWIAGAAAVAAAAALVLVVAGLEGRTVDRDARDSSVQAPHEGTVEATGGASSLRGRRKTAAGAAPRSTATPPDPVVVPPVVPEPPEEPPTVDVPTVDVSPAVEASPVATPEASPRKRSRPTPKATAEPSDAPSLAADVAQFKLAKRALDGGRPNEALQELDEYKRDFPRGAFRLEAQLLRAEALCKAGRAAQARTLRDRFVEAHAGSPLASRMRAVCAP
ncbi:MAG: hypothetical protein AAF721_18530 [Myxococcota bacterium]